MVCGRGRASERVVNSEEHLLGGGGGVVGLRNLRVSGMRWWYAGA